MVRGLYAQVGSAKPPAEDGDGPRGE
jgi:hypothetical protein